jgi:hypothetical protein
MKVTGTNKIDELPADAWCNRVAMNSSVLVSGRRMFKQLWVTSGIFLLLIVSILQPGRLALAEDHGRIKRPPPTPAEAERIASDMAMNDGSLQKGDIVSTDHGFFLYRGLAADGITNDFVRVPNPWSSREPRAQRVRELQ